MNKAGTVQTDSNPPPTIATMFFYMVGGDEKRKHTQRSVYVATQGVCIKETVFHLA